MKIKGSIAAIGLATCMIAPGAEAGPFAMLHSRVDMGESAIPGADGQYMRLCAEEQAMQLLGWTIQRQKLGHALAAHSCAAESVLPLSPGAVVAFRAEGLLPMEAARTDGALPAGLRGLIPLAVLMLSFAALNIGRTRWVRPARLFRARA
ncbi:hypothetical protein ACN2XU_12255 [Primorskyibacter sp. 2E107]|uniref:hypothetical protein n=1 Tax=Primorskyibacter sp. 2E107 TaxID=3403458 RepID=UPI003AF88E31